MRTLIVDIEATCWKISNRKLKPISEIIQIGYAIIDENNIINNGSILVRPNQHPNLSEFCTELTGITSDDLISGGASFSNAYFDFIEYIVPTDSSGFVSWGTCDWNIIEANCQLHNTVNYFYPDKHFDLKAWFSKKFNGAYFIYVDNNPYPLSKKEYEEAIENNKGYYPWYSKVLPPSTEYKNIARNLPLDFHWTIPDALRVLDLGAFDGRLHDAAADAMNVAKIYLELQDRELLNV